LKPLKSEDVFFDLKLRSAEIDQETVFNAGRSQVPKYLCDMLVSQPLASGLQFNNQAFLDKEIGKIITEKGPILVVHRKRELLLYIKPTLLKTMCQCVFVHLLQVAVAQVAMDFKRSFTDYIT